MWTNLSWQDEVFDVLKNWKILQKLGLRYTAELYSFHSLKGLIKDSTENILNILSDVSKILTEIFPNCMPEYCRNEALFFSLHICLINKLTHSEHILKITLESFLEQKL